MLPQTAMTFVTHNHNQLSVPGYQGIAKVGSPQTYRPEVLDKVEKVLAASTLKSTAVDYVRRSIHLGPSRKVVSRSNNVLTSFYSAKMDCRLMLESLTGEYPLAVLLEADENVLAYFPQPIPIERFVGAASSSKRTRNTYTPDMLVIRRDGIIVMEVRREASLRKQHDKNPHDVAMIDGVWRIRSVEDHFAQMGIKFELLANEELPITLVQNLGFLADYFRKEAPPLKEETRTRLQRTIKMVRSLKFYDLMETGFTADEINQAIAERCLYVDLLTDNLGYRQDLRLSVDKLTHDAMRLGDRYETDPMPIPGTVLLKVGDVFQYCETSYTVLMVSGRDVQAKSFDGRVNVFSKQEILEQSGPDGKFKVEGLRRPCYTRSLADLPPKALKRGQQRLELMGSSPESIAPRTLSRYKKAASLAMGGAERLLMLVGRHEERGNRTPRLSEENLQLISDSIKQRYNTPTRTTIHKAWEAYKQMCADQSIITGVEVIPASYPTYCKYARADESIYLRQGKRAAYQSTPIYTQLGHGFSLHGSYPHDVVYIDHTVADIRLVSPYNRLDLGKPTMTLAVDGCTGQTRAMYLSYAPASAATVLMLLRDYVRRNQRLPRVLAVDNGKEFHSEELRLFCTLYGIQIRYRPPGMPRSGHLIEKMMFVVEQGVLRDLAGNTIAMKKSARLMTKSVDPANHAEWTLPSLYEVIEDFLFNQHPNQISPTFGVSPNAKEQQMINETGERAFVAVKYDDNIILLTCPHAERRHRSVDPIRGVRVGNLYYNCEEFARLKRGSRVEVRVEPWHASVVYACIGNRWVAATSHRHRWLHSHTTRELEMTLRAEAHQAVKNAEKSRRCRQTLRPAALRPDMFDERIRREGLEMRHLYQKIGMAQPAITDPTPTVQVEPELIETAPTMEHIVEAKPSPQKTVPQESAEQTLEPRPEEIELHKLGFH